MVSRAAVANDPRSFGRRGQPLTACAPAAAADLRDASIIGDLKLFASAFAAGFLFVAVYIA